MPVVLAESDRDGHRRGRLRVALRSDDARLEVRGRGGAASSIGAPAPGARLAFNATAYCKGLTTASGVAVQTGVAAADPAAAAGRLGRRDRPLGTRYNGIYTIMDTGPKVQGRLVDIYMWSCHEALEFGRGRFDLTVLRLGWNPRATTPGFIDAVVQAPPAANAARVPSAAAADSGRDGRPASRPRVPA